MKTAFVSPLPQLRDVVIVAIAVFACTLAGSHSPQSPNLILLPIIRRAPIRRSAHLKP